MILRDEQLLKETTVTLKEGKGQIEFTSRIPKSGSYAFLAKINPEDDANEGNNQYEKIIQVTGGPKVLLVTNYIDDPLIKVLAQQNYRVEVVSDSQSLRVGNLLDTESVILNNIPAHEIPIEFLKAIPFYVEEQGGGFLMVGGNRSFGAGGYSKSVIDELLPVTMELKNDHRKLSLAMAIAIDRSGSMRAGVRGLGGGMMTKMELANNGAAEAIQLLGQKDQICLFAVDTQAKKIIPLQTIQGQRSNLKNKAMRVVSEGGGIYIYEALEKAWDEVRKSPYSTKHIILFADAQDSTDEGRYEDLLADMVKEGGTVSVIGMGNKSDSDAALLEDIAKRGKGRIFFTNNPVDIPKLFAQETVAIARSAFISESTIAIPTGKWQDISPAPMEWLPTIDGYNLSYLRKDATTALISGDEYKAPLVAHWQRGAGRVASISFPLGGNHSAQARAWKQYGDLSQTILRWINGDPLPPGLTMRHKLRGTNLNLDLFYDTEDSFWTKSFATEAPKILIQKNDQPPSVLNWKRVSPGHYELGKILEEGDLVKGVIKAGIHAFPFGPLKVDGNTEWKFVSQRIQELRTISTQTGGKELIDLSKAWERPETIQLKSLLPYLTILLLISVLIDAFITQTGFTFQKTTQKASKQKEIKPVKLPSAKERKAQVTETVPQNEDSPVDPQKQSRAERFAKAKKRR